VRVSQAPRSASAIAHTRRYPLSVLSPKAPLDFFAQQNFPYQKGYNTAEYLIDTLNSHSTQVGGAHDFEAYYAASSLAAENANAVREGDLQSSQLADLANDNNSSAVSKYANGSVRELMVLLRYKGLSRVKHPLFISTRYVLYFPNPNTVCLLYMVITHTHYERLTFLFCNHS
jgi:hypothetical protein